MLTKIVNLNQGINYSVGDKFLLDGKVYIIKEIEAAGSLARLWLDN